MVYALKMSFSLNRHANYILSESQAKYTQHINIAYIISDMQQNSLKWDESNKIFVTFRITKKNLVKLL